jgi:hypothetical protein
MVVENRLQEKYYLAWWFDKARGDIRALGIPGDAKWFICGVPVHLFRRLIRWTLQWMVTVNPRLRFEQKLKVWLNAGLIVECYRRSPNARQEKKPEAQTLGQRIWNMLD